MGGRIVRDWGIQLLKDIMNDSRSFMNHLYGCIEAAFPIFNILIREFLPKLKLKRAIISLINY